MLGLFQRHRMGQSASAKPRGADRKRSAVRRLFSESLERRMLLTTITGLSPLANSHDAPVSTSIAATFDQDINSATATTQTLVVMSRQGGPLNAGEASVATSGMTVTLDPSSNFFAGDVVQVSATSGIQSTTADPVDRRVWQFQLASGGSGDFTESGQSLGDPALNTRSWDVVLGDLDGDGDLDAFMSNVGVGYVNGAANRVYLNDGAGVFTDSGQAIGSHNSRHPSLGDMDGDGDLDAVVPNTSGHGNRLYTNNGSGVFTEQQVFGSSNSEDLALADLDGDGDLDVFVANLGQGNRVWRNDGGTLIDSGQGLGNHISGNVALGDLDNDGDIDAYVVNSNQNSRMWINDGNGRFSDSGQLMGSHFSESVAVGDLDGDGDLDVWVANNDYASRVWLNNGSGQFTDSGQQLFLSYNTSRIEDVELGDLDGDGDLDAFGVNNNSQPNRVWANDGNGVFSDFGGASLDINTNSLGVALGDVNGDGSLDAVVANDAISGGTNSVGRVWLNRVLTPSVTLAVDNSTIGEAVGAAMVTATLSAAHTEPVTIDLGFSGTATDSTDYTVSAAQIMIPPGATTGSVTVTAVQDTTDEPDETVVVDINSVANGQETGAQQVTITILDDDEPVMPAVTLSANPSEIAEAGGVATLTVTLSEITTVPVTVDLSISGTADASDYTASGTQVVIEPGATSGAVTITAVQDEVNEPDETVIVDITSVTGGNEDGDQQQTTTIVDDDSPPSFAVTSFEASESGFRVEFTNELDAGDLNLYDTQNAGRGPADVVITGATSGPVAGSLVIETSAVTFIKAGDPLAADTYTVTLRSAADGFEDTGAALLDGNGDGTGGDDYQNNFMIDEAAASARTISIPDFVRGPGQEVNVPADGSDIPITISEGDNVRAADIRIRYNPALLEISGATAPAGGSVIVNTTTTPGVAILVFFSSASLPAGSSTFINLQATVPAADASANYGLQQVLDLHSVTIGDGNDNEFAVVVDDAHHLVTYFADVSGNGRINASDAAQVARFAALIDAGFAGSLNADPVTVGDISGNGRINAADASRVAQFAALIEVPEIPPVPGGIQITGLVNLSLGNAGTTPILVGPFAGQSEGGNRAESAASEFPVVENFVSKGSETANIDQVAVDQMMAYLANSVDDEQAELGSASVLEGTLEELLSAVD